MKILGIIAEYNPFHNGHLYHINASRKKSNCDAVVIAMSGNFVQRGEPAIIDKWRRAESAIFCGADLVVEIQQPYSCQNAEMFASAAFKALESIPIDTLSFGCENSNIELLYQIANLQLHNSLEYNNNIKNFLNLGLSYPNAVNKTISKLLGEEAAHYISTPNNLLSLEYLKNCSKSKHDIDILPITRKGANYNDQIIDGLNPSATSIRNALLKNDLTLIKNVIPKKSYALITDFYTMHGKFNSLDNYLDIIYYSIISNNKEHLENIFNISEGLENRIYNNIFKHDTINDFILSLKSKRYTYARIRRILLNILLNINKNLKNDFPFEKSNYIKVLAFNNMGRKVLKEAKNSNTQIITKTSDYKKAGIDLREDKLFQFTNKTTNMYFLPFSNKEKMFNTEYKHSANYIDI